MYVLRKRHVLPLVLLLVVCNLLSCAYSPSLPRIGIKIQEDQGVLIFSTQSDSSTTNLGQSGVDVLNAIATLGLSEVDRGNIYIEIAGIGVDEENNLAFSGYRNPKKYAHSFRSKNIAMKQKWHVIPLKSGVYEIYNLIFEKGSSSIPRSVFLPRGLLRFNVEPGQVTYFGDIKLALKDMVMSKTYGGRSQEQAPMITSVQWREEGAVSVLKRFPYISNAISGNKVDVETINKSLIRMEKRRLHQIDRHQLRHTQ